MKKVCKKAGIWGILLGIMLFAVGFTLQATTVETQAAAITGFRTINGKTYYYKNGKKVKGWLTLGNNKYFLNTKTGVLYKGWQKSSKGPKRYFDSKTGVMSKGLKKVGGNYYYFKPSTGYTVSGFVRFSKTVVRYFSPGTYTMATGWMKNSKGQKWYFRPSDGVMYRGLKKIGSYYYYFDGSTGATKSGFLTAANGNVRYFRGKTYIMATGWLKNSKGGRYYFAKNTGVMYKGFKSVDGKKYYFNPKTGLVSTGWISVDGKKYYIDPSTTTITTGKKLIDGTYYVFDSNGVLTDSYKESSNSGPTTPTSARTIKNYLAGALQPVGQALYVWGGGWNDSNRKGVSPTWISWYNSQNSNYDYNNYRDLSDANRAKGLDCSGFVGWASYQVMHKKSGESGGYTVVSGDIGSYYQNTLKWGKIVNQNYLSQSGWKMQPGDIGYDDGHTWIILGQCPDKSAVVIHSTPQAGCQLAGTCTPSGDYDSQAVALAKTYMSRYKGFTKYNYHTSCGNYIRRGNYLRWYSSTLSDPEGYKNKTAAQILADLYS